jgi:hypothetical protein
VSGLENQRKTSDLRGTMIMPVMLGAMSSRVQSDGPLSDIHQTISGTIVLSRKQDATTTNERSRDYSQIQAEIAVPLGLVATKHDVRVVFTGSKNRNATAEGHHHSSAQRNLNAACRRCAEPPLHFSDLRVAILF